LSYTCEDLLDSDASLGAGTEMLTVDTLGVARDARLTSDFDDLPLRLIKGDLSITYVTLVPDYYDRGVLFELFL